MFKERKEKKKEKRKKKKKCVYYFAPCFVCWRPRNSVQAGFKVRIARFDGAEETNCWAAGLPRVLTAQQGCWGYFCCTK